MIIQTRFFLCIIFERYLSEQSVKKHWTVEEFTRVYFHDNLNFDKASMSFLSIGQIIGN